MNKNILIITPFFPPQTHAAVFRAFKLVKYLKRTGWNPIVLTVNRNYLYLEDPDLLDRGGFFVPEKKLWQLATNVKRKTVEQTDLCNRKPNY